MYDMTDQADYDNLHHLSDIADAWGVQLSDHPGALVCAAAPQAGALVAVDVPTSHPGADLWPPCQQDVDWDRADQALARAATDAALLAVLALTVAPLAPDLWRLLGCADRMPPLRAGGGVDGGWGWQGWIAPGLALAIDWDDYGRRLVAGLIVDAPRGWDPVGDSWDPYPTWHSAWGHQPAGFLHVDAPCRDLAHAQDLARAWLADPYTLLPRAGDLIGGGSPTDQSPMLRALAALALRGVSR